jgi:hypothetical protein
MYGIMYVVIIAVVYFLSFSNRPIANITEGTGEWSSMTPHSKLEYM